LPGGDPKAAGPGTQGKQGTSPAPSGADPIGPNPSGVAAGQGGQVPTTQSPKDVVAKLFQPGKETGEDQRPTHAGIGKDDRSQPQPKSKTPTLSEADKVADPVERAAALRLQQAVQRIQSRLDNRRPAGLPRQGSGAGGDWRRDW